MSSKHVVVIGGSIAGLGVALALSGRGHRVTILEADATPLPASHDEAFARWKRRGAPQTRHSHALLARLRNLIRDHAPELLEKLLACGAGELRFTERARELFTDPVLEEGDEDIVALACRRITFEWILRRHVLDTGLVDFRDGVAVERLHAERDPASGLPWVKGVWAVDAKGDAAPELVSGDLVVDASGRRSELYRWLPEIGTRAVREASSPCGIFYTSRFYRLLDGVEPPSFDGGIIGADLGYLKVGIFAGDSRVFSITLAASPTDVEMRRLLRQPLGFETAVAAVPLAAEWTSPEVSEPVSDVHGMANLTNTRRWLVEDGEPLALGFVAVGDSLIHTNPIVGRGCSHAWTAAFALADCLDATGDEPRTLALAYDARIDREIVPWYLLQVAQDADAIEVAEAQQRGDDPFHTTNPDGSQNPKAFVRSLIKDGLLPALREDLVVLRTFLRTLHLLDPPGDLMKNPVVMQRVLEVYARREEREKVVLGPSRSVLLERFAARESERGESRPPAELEKQAL
ncbi:MAG: FAD-dependent oxidoreductase [Deltaproteobacteria bacterium]|nr:FAD-dependent oxidoreductase [Deltaproteobacteria bacterium]